MNAPVQTYQINGHSVSSQHFYAAACHPGRAVVVEACAGAGKTWMLVSRIVRALLTGASPEQILAITFTKKAAAEMGERLQEWLAAFVTLPLDRLAAELELRGLNADEARQQAPALQGLYLRLLQHGRPVQIRTFHSWFSALLRAAPLQLLQQLGLPAEYELIEDEARIIPLVWQPFHAAVLRDAQVHADYQALVSTHGRSNARKALENALARRTELALADDAGMLDASVPPFAEFFPEMQGLEQPSNWLLQRESGRTTLLAAAQALGAAQARTFQEKGAELEQAVAASNWDNVWAALFTGKNEPRKFSEKISNLDAVRTAQDAALQVQRAQQQHAAWQHHQRMTRLAHLLRQVYADLKRNRGWIDMNDIETAAHVLLQDTSLSGWLQERLDARVRHLLIDEFQDTNPLQWQALHAWLQSYAGASDAPGIFIVGDPKQSIYRFRRAAPEVFDAAKSFVQQGLNGDLLSCDHTRRNAPAVVNAINAVMTAAQAAGDFSGFRPHTTAASADGCVLTLPRIERPGKAATQDSETNDPFNGDPGDSEGFSSWRNSLTMPQTSPDEQLRLRECRQAAGWLAQWLRAGMPAAEILVLARKNDTLAAMQQALAEQGIHAELADKSKLADAPEVQDVVALVDALISPRHDLSLARALRSPLFGLDEYHLTTIALGVQAAAQAPTSGDGDAATSGRLSWLDWLLAAFDASSPDAQDAGPLPAVAARLRRWQDWLQRLPPHDAIDAIYRDGDVLARYAAATPAANRARVLERLRALPGQALALDGGRYPSAYGWVRALRAATGENAPTPAKPNSVRLLTVHGAKGLEAALVLLLNTDAEQDRAKSMEILIDWPGHRPCPDRVVFLANGSQPPPSAQTLFDHENRAATREERNAWYVAMTRAGRVLALSAAEPHRPNPASWWRQMQAVSAAHAVPLAEDGSPHLDDALRALAQSVCANDLKKPSQQEQHTAQAGPPADALPFLPCASSCGLDTPGTAAHQPPVQSAQSLQATLGEAMHRTLEWHRPGQPLDTQPLRHALASQYSLTEEQVDTVLQRAQAILQGEGAWVWDAAQLDWQANEVDIAWQGRTLRIDRLVRQKTPGGAPPIWWVLDFKSALDSNAQDTLRNQLADYREAVMRLHPQETVRAAFLTAQGKLVEPQ